MVQKVCCKRIFKQIANSLVDDHLQIFPLERKYLFAGIQSHFDDSERFIQPIYSLRIFSDSRLSFGGTLFGNTNAMFFTPMPRGCVTVMEGYGKKLPLLAFCIYSSEIYHFSRYSDFLS